MNFAQLPDGLRSLLADAALFARGVSWDRPRLFALIAAPLLVWLLGRIGARTQNRRLAALGRPAALAALLTGPRRGGRLARCVIILAWQMLVLALAGPRWGSAEDGVAVGRDVVLVVDFSRSMWAEDVNDRTTPARWQSAVAGAREIVAAARRNGGHRVAVIIFAARPLLIVPLTTDVDHLDARLADLDARQPPAAIRPAADDEASGTRIGAALALAVAAHDPRFPGVQDIVLFTDADDPADDAEWRSGVSAARAANIPLHVVGLGDPAVESFLLDEKGEPLEGPLPDGGRAQIQTRLHEEIAGAIATEGRGVYVASRTAAPRRADFARTILDGPGMREVGDERLPQRQDRAGGFYALAAVLFVAGWWREFEATVK